MLDRWDIFLLSFYCTWWCSLTSRIAFNREIVVSFRNKTCVEWKGVIYVYLNRKIVLFTRHFFFHDKKKKKRKVTSYSIRCILFYYSNFLFSLLTKKKKIAFLLSTIYHLRCPFFFFFVFYSIVIDFFNISTRITR